MKCTLHEDYVELEYRSQNGTIRERLISMQDFTKVLAATAKVENFAHVLPPGARYVAKKGAEVYIGVEFFPCIREMKHVSKKAANTPLPGGIFFVCAKEVPGGFAFSGLSLFATKGIITDGNAMLYDWPGANVGGEGGVCMGRGASSFQKLKSYKQIGDIAHLFFQYTANNDMSGNRFTPYKGVSDPQELYILLEKEKATEFPLEVLRPICTISEYLNRKELSFNV